MYSSGRDRKNIIKHRILWGCMVSLTAAAVLCALSCMLRGDVGKGNDTQDSLEAWLEYACRETYLPVFAFIERQTGICKEPEAWLEEFISVAVPVYHYSMEQEAERSGVEDEKTYDLLIRREGADEEYKAPQDGSLEYEEDALHIDKELKSAMRRENELHQGETSDEKLEEENKEVKQEDEAGSEDEWKEEENSFCKAESKSYEYDWSEVNGYEEIVSAFYAIDSTTSITDEQLNLENLLGRDMGIEKNEDGPQILIYHTHSQEGFADSVEGDASTTIVGAGDRLAQLLQDTYGYNVLHHKGEYDVEARDYAYSNSLPAIEQLLLSNPSIEVVIDLHRDAVDEGRKLVVDMQGRPTAQFMFFNGLSRTKKNGDIDYLENPYINDNLAFSFQAQVAANEYYPGIARRIYLKAYRYNMHLRAKSMLVELGAQTNTVEEIMNACDPLAHVIAKVLSGETGDTARAAAGIE